MLIVIIQPCVNSLNLQAYNNKYYINPKVTSIFIIMFMCACIHTRTYTHVGALLLSRLDGCSPGENKHVSEPANGFHVVLPVYYDKIFTPHTLI